MIGHIISLIGMWFLSDGIYSWKLYVNAPSYQGSSKQTFRRDHWIRLLRIILSIVLICIGVTL